MSHRRRRLPLPSPNNNSKKCGYGAVAVSLAPAVRIVGIVVVLILLGLPLFLLFETVYAGGCASTQRRGIRPEGNWINWRNEEFAFQSRNALEYECENTFRATWNNANRCVALCVFICSFYYINFTLIYYIIHLII